MRRGRGAGREGGAGDGGGGGVKGGEGGGRGGGGRTQGRRGEGGGWGEKDKDMEGSPRRRLVERYREGHCAALGLTRSALISQRSLIRLRHTLMFGDWQVINH